MKSSRPQLATSDEDIAAAVHTKCRIKTLANDISDACVWNEESKHWDKISRL